MSDKPVPIDLVPYAELIRGSRNSCASGRPKAGLSPVSSTPSRLAVIPMGFGIALVDCIRHGAKTWARATGISEREAVARIWEGVDAERANPTDIPTEIPTTDEDGLLH